MSSVLGKNSKLYGKQHLTDGREETCWNSEQGRPQTIVCGLANAAARVEQIVLTFQGGFAAKTCEVWMGGDELKLRTTLYPADSNAEQICFLFGPPLWCCHCNNNTDDRLSTYSN